ncbi:hypothetical protein [Parerythrobacter jejuensis]|uniref:Uncharacterized protein n=1 Tax=Parerythrobacter jejuensis TaxID=795812 RepID=A0A845AN21_9SPHN|nr:hypothetical protein [Parerythrobacter jejuensis]MXP31014.1 hypothetical protein [Parerythrobacter jejuensis]MXP33774.1 hypothetical protein [Parerythrobacter jejuensis]
MIRIILAGLTLVASSLAGPAAVAMELPVGFSALRAKDERVQRIGFALATGNARFCERTTPATGLLLHDVATYPDGDELRDALGLMGDIGVQGVVPGSPAEKAGLRPDQSVLMVAQSPVSSFALDRKKRWKRLEDVRKAIDASLSTSGDVVLSTARDTDAVEIRISGVQACRSRFEVGPLGKRAVADGERVVIGNKFPGHAYPDELMAAVMAHELAHNVLRHRAWFDANGGRKRKAVRITEREADRLMPWLLANSGYDPRAAVRFMQEWGPDHSGGIFRKRTHDGWDERVEFIEAETVLVERLFAATGQADWRTHFKRETLPAPK